ETYERLGRADQQDLLEKRFAGAGWEVPRLLDAMRSATDFYFDSVGQVHLDEWSRGRVVLLGDAGYCPSPLAGVGRGPGRGARYIPARERVGARGGHRDVVPRHPL